MFEDEVVGEEAGHFQVIDCEVALRIGGRDEAGSDVGWPGEPLSQTPLAPFLQASQKPM